MFQTLSETTLETSGIHVDRYASGKRDGTIRRIPPLFVSGLQFVIGKDIESPPDGFLGKQEPQSQCV